MADYKIANIKWLRDRGWSIPSSYADSMCPTYNEIVNEIPKGSTTVNVNGTCIATSKAYANNQLVCESDITIGQAVDCSTYNFDDLTPQMAHTAFERIPIAQSNYNKEQLSWTINDNWITDVAVSSYEPAPGAICWRYGISVVANPTTDERNGSVTFTSTDGCSFTGHCTQTGQPAVDCSVYNWTQYTSTLEPSTTGYALATSSRQQQALNVQVVDSGGFVQRVYNIPFSSDKHGYYGEYSQNTTTSPRQATIKYTSKDGYCEWTQVVTQLGPSVFTVDPIIYISADGGTAHGNVISTIGGESVGFSINNSTLQCPSYNGWTVVANTSNSRIDVTAGSTSSSKECGNIKVVQDQTGRYVVFKIIQSAPTAKDITINLIPSENGTVYTSNYYGRTWYVNWKIYYKYDSSKTAVASGTIGYENKTEGQQATYSSTMHVPNLSMPFTEYFVDFTTTTCSIYKPNNQLVTPPSICYEGDSVTTYETHMEPLGTFYDSGIFNILTSLI